MESPPHVPFLCLVGSVGPMTLLLATSPLVTSPLGLSPAAELQEVPPPPPPEDLLEHVIKGDQEPTIRATESDRSIEQIDNPDGVLDRQE